MIPGLVYPALVNISSIIAIADGFQSDSPLHPPPVAWLNSISDRINTLLGISSWGMLNLTAWFRMVLKAASKLVDIPQSALASCLYRSLKGPNSFWIWGLEENVINISLNAPSFLSEIYIPKDIATSMHVRFALPPTETPIEPETSTIGSINSSEPSIQLGRASHCSLARSWLPPNLRFLVIS